MTCLFEHTDQDGDRITVEDDHPHSRTFIVAATHGTNVPAAKIPALCRALYESAGLEAPELPEIADLAMADKLTDALSSLRDWSVSNDAIARKLVAEGWTCAK